VAEPSDKQGAEPAAVEPDTLFRIQVGIQDFFLANVRYLGVAVAVGLFGFAIYGGYDWYTTRQARAEFGAIAVIDYKMPKAAEMSELGLTPADDPSDQGRLQNVEKGAELYEQAAKSANGVAAVYAWLKAAETWNRLHKSDKALLAYEQADKVGAADLPGFTAVSGYATALVGAGRQDDAITALRAASTRLKDFYAEEALIQLAQVQADAGKAADAQGVIQEFRTRFPDSPRAAHLAALGLATPPEAAAPAAPSAAPTPTPASPPATPAPPSGG